MEKPSVTATRHTLSFEKLEPKEFERLGYWLIDEEYDGVEYVGEEGKDQGRDVIGFFPETKELWYFQIKRYKDMDVPTLTKEIDKIEKLSIQNEALKPVGIIFIIMSSVSTYIRDEVRNYGHKKGFDISYWAGATLDRKVKKYPKILEEFFSLSDGFLSKPGIKPIKEENIGPSPFNQQIDAFDSPLLAKIRSRGYLRIIIRPESFNEERIENLASIYPTLQKVSVILPNRGWQFPHFQNTNPNLGMNWVGQEFDEVSLFSIIESWRFFQSGQFIHYSNDITDWQSESNSIFQTNLKNVKPKSIILLDDFIARLTEIFIFTTRLINQGMYSEQENIQIITDYFDLDGRMLSFYNHNYLFQYLTNTHTIQIQSFSREKTLKGSDLILDPKKYAIDFAIQFCHRFNYDAPRPFLEKIQNDFLKNS